VPSAGAAVLVRASVSSAAGKPSGLCAFDRRAQSAKRWQQVRRVGLRRQSCSAAIAPEATGSVRFRVRFVPNRGWLPSAATTPRILIG
jgi:hypothetical protein